MERYWDEIVRLLKQGDEDARELVLAYGRYRNYSTPENQADFVRTLGAVATPRGWILPTEEG